MEGPCFSSFGQRKSSDLEGIKCAWLPRPHPLRAHLLFPEPAEHLLLLAPAFLCPRVFTNCGKNSCGVRDEDLERPSQSLLNGGYVTDDLVSGISPEHMSHATSQESLVAWIPVVDSSKLFIYRPILDSYCSAPNSS